VLADQARLRARHLAGRLQARRALRSTRTLLSIWLLVLSGAAYVESEALAQTKESAEQVKYREAAQAHFAKRCKEDAGERIYRAVERVEGFLLSNPQPKLSEADIRDQYWKGNLYGFFLYPPAELSAYLFALDGNGIPTTLAGPAYLFVEVSNGDGTFNRYRKDLSTKAEMSFENVSDSRSRYAVSREDFSTAEDRRFWVAGGRLRVVELKSGEVLGERIGYVFERGFGSTHAARRPWLFAQRNACPPLTPNESFSYGAIDRQFVEKVLKLTKESGHAR